MLSTFSFSLSLFPRIDFGSGTIKQLPEKIALYGQRVLLITGSHSFYQTPKWQQLISELEQQKIQWFHTTITGEPSPQFIDANVEQFHASDIQCVVAIGGGSALDSGKAISGLLHSGDSVMEYLEGVGEGKHYRGPAVPFIAVPTTAEQAVKPQKMQCSVILVRKVIRSPFEMNNLFHKTLLLIPIFWKVVLKL